MVDSDSKLFKVGAKIGVRNSETAVTLEATKRKIEGWFFGNPNFSIESELT